MIPLMGNVQNRQIYRLRVGSWLSGLGQEDGGDTDGDGIAWGEMTMLRN